ncbi:MAG: hypothetical protein DRP56_06295 [Planctomycetota bacterium]|nr:MAG: hypothetical protein DRP56_06295 [Planctomycetota bacterium]
MKTQKTIMLVITLALCATTYVQAASESSLQFITIDKPIQWVAGEPDRGTLAQGDIHPTHAATLYLKGKRILPDFKDSKFINSLLSNSEGQQLSKKQVEFINSEVYFRQEGDFGKSKYDHYQFKLYGVSKEDTEQMVKTFIQYFVENAQNDSDVIKPVLPVFQEQLVFYKTELSELLQKDKEISDKLKEELRSEICSSIEEAQRRFSDFNQKENALFVESAGIKAQLEEIGQTLDRIGQDDNKTLRAKLEEKMNGLNIELAGVEAKSRESRMWGSRIMRPIHLSNKLEKSKAEVDFVKNEVSQIEQIIEQLKSQLAKPNMMQPIIYENEIKVFPVK